MKEKNSKEEKSRKKGKNRGRKLRIEDGKKNRKGWEELEEHSRKEGKNEGRKIENGRKRERKELNRKKTGKEFSLFF